MTLKQLEYLIVVAETGSITEAARKLYIAQPSLTAAIHELENLSFKPFVLVTLVKALKAA